MQIRTKNMTAVFEEERAAFLSIKGTGDRTQTEFLLGPEEFPEYDTDQPRWLGNLFLTVKNDSGRRRMSTGASRDTKLITCDPQPAAPDDRTHSGEYRGSGTAFGGTGAAPGIQSLSGLIRVIYPGDSGNENGIRGICVEEDYRICLEGIHWSIVLRNISEQPVTVAELGIPLFMNQYFRNDSEFKYEKCVLRHSLISHHNSALYWSKSSGNPPILYLMTTGDTALDQFAVEEEDKNFGACWKLGAFEGCYTVYPIHEETDRAGIPTQELMLAPGEEKSFTFFLGMADSFEEMAEQKIALGGMEIKAVPGMCVPVGQEAVLLIRSLVRPELQLPDPDDQILGIQEKEGCFLCKIRLGGYGIREVLVRSGNTCMRLSMFGLEKPEDIIRRQAAFIAEKQFETDPSDPCYHGLLMWDMTVKHRINASCNPFGDNWFAGGSDEIGLANGLFLAGKNVWQPVEKEVRVLQSYVKDFIEARLTEQPGYRVHRMVPWYEMFEPWAGRGADDVWRAFNYVHVINTYYNMYLIAKIYDFGFLDSPSYYIRQAWEYTNAMFAYWMFPDGVGASEYGNMGELHLALNLEGALREEGFLKEAALLNGIVCKKADFFAGKVYPYGSEMAYDSTAFEAVYAYGKAAGNRRVMEMTKNVVLANRGRQPSWYLYQTDLRQNGDSSWNVSYMTQLGAWPLYDWLFEQGEYTPELAESWYASYLAGWSVYNSGGFWSEEKENEGASGWIVDGKMGRFTGMKSPREPYKKGIVPMSGESALGFYGALQTAAAAVTDHPGLGRYGFGCQVRETEEGEEIVPEDGLGVRLYHIPDGWSVTLDRDRIRRAVVRKGELLLILENLTGDVHETGIVCSAEGRKGKFSVRMGKKSKSEKLFECRFNLQQMTVL